MNVRPFLRHLTTAGGALHPDTQLKSTLSPSLTETDAGTSVNASISDYELSVKYHISILKISLHD